MDQNQVITGRTRNTRQWRPPQLLMKQVFLCLAIVLHALSLSFSSEARAWSPTQPQVSVSFMGGAGKDVGRDVMVDSSGDLISVGTFGGTADFDPGQNSTNLSGGTFSSYIAKLNRGGNLVWAKHLSGHNRVSIHTADVDDVGNIYATGEFAGDVDFDPGPGTMNLSAVAGAAFVATWDTTGRPRWVRQFGRWGDVYGEAIATDTQGNVYSSGFFSATVDFDPGPSTLSLTPTDGGGRDAYLTKLDALGNLAWVRQIGGGSTDEGKALAIHENHIYIAGEFHSVLRGSFAALTSHGGSDAFVGKFDQDGHFVWAKHIGSVVNDSAASLTVDRNGSLFLCGSFQGLADLDPGVGSLEFASFGHEDAYVAKLDPQGTLLWARTFGGTGTDVCEDTAVDGSSNVVVTGSFTNTSDFSFGAGTARLSSWGSSDVFIAKLTSSGHLSWVRQFGGLFEDRAFAVVIDSSDVAFVTGSVWSSPSYTLAGVDIAAKTSGNLDAFVLGITPEGIAATTTTTTTTSVIGTTTTTSLNVPSSEQSPIVRTSPQVRPQPKLKRGRSLGLANLVKYTNLTVPKGASIRATVSNNSRKKCKISLSSLVALKPGQCSVKLSVTPRAGRVQSQWVTVGISS